MADRTYDLLAGLPLHVDSYRLDALTRTFPPSFERCSTLVRLRGGGHEGLGEDVGYDGEGQRAFRRWSRVLPLTGRYTLAELSERLDSIDLFPRPPQQKADRFYRRWAVESAALDLALRQGGHRLSDALGREPRPVRFVVSPRLGFPPSIEPVRQLLELRPGLGLKLDATSSWTPDLIADLAATGAVETLDFKGAYRGTVVDQPADPALYVRVVEAFPRAWLEDPALTEQTAAILDGQRDRISWDAPIHSVADIEALPFPPRALNIKPSRLGSVRALLDVYDYCRRRGIEPYGGGQFEIGPGRGQIQYLASLFHPSAPNDVAPIDYNAPPFTGGLLDSPLRPAPAPLGFRWNDGHRSPR